MLAKDLQSKLMLLVNAYKLQQVQKQVFNKNVDFVDAGTTKGNSKQRKAPDTKPFVAPVAKILGEIEIENALLQNSRS